MPLDGYPMILESLRLSCLGLNGNIRPAKFKRRYETNSCMRFGKPSHQARQCNLDELRISELSLQDKETGAPVYRRKDYTVAIVTIMVKKN